MSKHIRSLLIAVLLFAPWALWAQTLTLDDFDGVVEVKAGTAWKAVELGDKVPYDSTIRVSNHGLAEFRDGATRIHLSKDGAYQLSALVARAKDSPAPTALTQAAGKVGMMLGDKGQARSAVPVANMGARGAEVDPSAGLTWSEDEPADTKPGSTEVADIENLVAAGKLDAALARSDASLKSGNGDKMALRLMKARILAQMGRAGSALREALAAGVTTSSSLYPASALLITSQAVLVEDWDLALQKTKEGRAATQDPDLIQNLDLMTALAYRGQGQTKAYQDQLQKVVNQDPTSAAGQQAAKLLKS
jgi:hypothetical protein